MRRHSTVSKYYDRRRGIDVDIDDGKGLSPKIVLFPTLQHSPRSKHASIPYSTIKIRHRVNEYVCDYLQYYFVRNLLHVASSY